MTAVPTAAADVRVEILGGIAEIGYSMVLVSTSRARLLLDMGMRGLDDGPLRPPAAPRDGLALVDLLRGGVLRALPGLYDPRQLAAAPELAGARFAQPDPRPTAIVLSHAHVDHEGALCFARPELALYTSPDTARVLAAVEAAGERRHGHPLDPRAVTPGTPTRWHDLSFELVPVNHDVPGACGVIVHTPAGRLAYTGDFNLHRDGGLLTRAFAERIRGCELLVTETTMLSWDAAPGQVATEPPDEPAVLAGIAAAIPDEPVLALCSLYPRDVERSAAAIEVAARRGRTLVWPARDAAFLHAMGVDGVTVWAPDRAERDAERVPGGVRVVELAQVRADPGRFLVQPDAREPSALADLPLTPGRSVWIHAQGEPLGPFMAGWAPFQEWLQRCGVTAVQVGSTGHASASALEAFVTDVAPQCVIPIHGFRPEALRTPVRTVLPEYGVQYTLDGRPAPSYHADAREDIREEGTA